jgi:tryptophanase
MTFLSKTGSAPPPSHSAVVVRSLLPVTAEEREKTLNDTEYNVFAFPAGLLTCDFLSDSGTTAMTDVQWAASKFYEWEEPLSVISINSDERR